MVNHFNFSSQQYVSTTIYKKQTEISLILHVSIEGLCIVNLRRRVLIDTIERRMNESFSLPKTLLLSLGSFGRVCMLV